MNGRRPRPSRAVATLAGALALAGCAWPFGANQPAERPMDGPGTIREEEQGILTGLFSRRPADLPDAVPIAAVRTAVLEPAFGGVILRVTAVAPSQGFFNATLSPENDGRPDAAGLVTVALRAVPPPTPQAIGPERTRLLMTAAFVQTRELRGIRGFRVVAGPNVITLPLAGR